MEQNKVKSPKPKIKRSGTNNKISKLKIHINVKNDLNHIQND